MPLDKPAGTVHLWEADSGLPHLPPLPQDNYVIALDFSPDGETLATGDYCGFVRFWNTRTGQPAGQSLVQQAIVLCLAYSPDGRRLLAGLADNHGQNAGTQLWDLATGQPLGPYFEHKHWVVIVAFSPDGRTALTGARDGTVRLWNGLTGESLGEPLPLAGTPTTAVFRPDSKQLATGCSDGTVRLWDTATGKPVPGGLLAHPYPISALAFSADGRYLLAGCKQGISRLWDLATHRGLGPPFVQRYAILAVAFRPDGRSFTTIDESGDTRVWRIPEPPAETDVERLTLRLQVRTGLALDAGQSPVPLDTKSWQARRERLAATEGASGPPLAPGLGEAAWHDARARDAEQDDDDFGVLWHLDRLAALKPEDWSVPARRARAHALAGRLEQADADYARAASLAGPARLLDWYLHGAADCERRKQWATALWYVNRVLAARPTDWRLYYWRATIQAQLGKTAESEGDSAKAVELGADGSYLSRLAQGEVDRGRWDRAAELFAGARRQSFLPQFQWTAQGLVCLQVGDSAGYRDVCAQVYQQLTRDVPPWVLQQEYLELCLVGPAAFSDYAQVLDLAERMARSAANRTPDEQHEMLSFWGALHYRAGQYAEAIRRLQERLAAANNQPGMYDYLFLAMAHQRLGKTVEARQWLERALARPLPDSTYQFWDRMAVELIRREAQALIR
jgi:Flp pilus assembly protein TadD